MDELKVNADGSLEILERIDGGKHQVSVCAAAPALLGWATGNLAEPKNNPQVGMMNMRVVMPALQKPNRPRPGRKGSLLHPRRPAQPDARNRMSEDAAPEEIAAS